MFRICVFIVGNILKIRYYKSEYSFEKKKSSCCSKDFMEGIYNYTALDICLKIDHVCQRALFLLLTQANCAELRQEFCHIFTAKFSELLFTRF